MNIYSANPLTYYKEENRTKSKKRNIKIQTYLLNFVKFIS